MLASPLRRFLPANATNADFPAIPDALTGPSLTVDAVMLSESGSGEVPESITLWPFGLGANDDAFSIRVVGYQRILPHLPDGRSQWVGTIIAEIGCVISTDVGLAGGIVLDTERYADTITVVSEARQAADVTPTGTILVTQPGANLKAHVTIPIEGVSRLRLIFDQTTGTPGMNALYRLNRPNP